MSKQVAYLGDVTRQRDGISDFRVSVCRAKACQADRVRVGQHLAPAPTTKATLPVRRLRTRLAPTRRPSGAVCPPQRSFMPRPL